MPSDSQPSGNVDRILGIDPGINTTGYGVIDSCTDDRNTMHPQLIEAGVVRSTAKRSLTYRIREIHEGICEVITQLRPGALAIEELYSHYERPRTAILMGHARGVICLAAALHDVSVKHYGATRVKKLVTGNGHAPKSQIQAAIQREFRLAAPPQPADVADALAVALCHLQLRQRKEMNLTNPTDVPNDL